MIEFNPEPEFTGVIHLISFGGEFGEGTLCQGGVIGDKAITVNQARDPTSDMTFNCAACYKVLTGEDPI